VGRVEREEFLLPSHEGTSIIRNECQKERKIKARNYIKIRGQQYHILSGSQAGDKLRHVYCS
jgi:hypothetical protein